MKIDLTYADGTLSVDIPDSIKVDFFSPGAAETAVDERSFARLYRESFGKHLPSGQRLLVVVNDAYRDTPTATILGWLNHVQPELIESASFLVSTGIHPTPGPEHYRRIFGDLWTTVRDRVSGHDAHDAVSLVSLGKDRFGQEVRVNRAVLEHAHVLVIGSVEPHYFAGYTGGRKAIFPGLADFETIARNHNLANSLEAAPLRLRGNPVAEHLDSLLNMLDQDKILGIQVVSDCSHKLAGVFCGPLNRAFHEACKMAEDVYSCAVSAPYDIVLCEVLPPLDRNLYQAQKALENCQAAVTDGGVVVIVSACTEGVGSEYFYRLAASWDKSANRAGDGGLHFGSHKLSRVIEIGRRIDVLLHSTLPPDMVRRVFYEPLDNLPDFSYSRGQECEIRNMAVVHDAANLVLMTN